MNVLTKFLPALLLIVTLTACAAGQGRYRAYTEPDPAPPPELATEVYYYPLQGQSIEQQDRDRYECYLWAKRESGFDPSYPHLAPHQRTIVVPDPTPGHDTAAGVVTGAVLGAVVGAPHHAGEGALIGALAGGALGAASDAARQEHAEKIEEHYEQQDQNRKADLDRQAENYRRAMKACLAGRGYSVR